jgi:hypothetical protein
MPGMRLVIDEVLSAVEDVAIARTHAVKRSSISLHSMKFLHPSPPCQAARSRPRNPSENAAGTVGNDAAPEWLGAS